MAPQVQSFIIISIYFIHLNAMCNVFPTVNKINLIFRSLNVIAYLYIYIFFFAFPFIYFSLKFLRISIQIDRNLAKMIQFTIFQVAAII